MTPRPKDGRSRRQPKEQTRRDILDAALQIMVDDGATEQIDLRLSTVLDHMGLTSGAAYNIWSSQGEFRRDLAHHLLEEYSWAGPDHNEIKIDFDARPTDEIRRLAELYLWSLTDDTQFYLTLRFWGVKDPSEELQQSIQAGYAANHDLWRRFYRDGFDWAGLRLRDGYTLDDFVVMATMVTEGAALRHRFDPDGLRSCADRNLYCEVLVALVEQFTEAVVDPSSDLTPPDSAATAAGGG